MEPEPELFQSWIEAHCDAGDFEKSSYLQTVPSVCQAMRSSGVVPTPAVGAALLAAVLRNGRLQPRALVKRRKKVERELASAGWEPGREEGYRELLRAFAARRVPAGVAALRTLHQMRKDPAVASPPCVDCYDAVIKALIPSKDWRPPRSHLHGPPSAWTTRERSNLRLAVARHVPEPEVWCDPKAPSSARPRDKEYWRRVEEWKKVAAEVGTGRTWSACQARWHREQAARRDAGDGGSAPLDMSALLEAVGTQSAVGKGDSSDTGPVRKGEQVDWALKAAVRCLHAMAEDGHTPPLRLCHRVLRACHWRPWIALSVLDDMQRWGVKVDEQSLHLLVQSCVKAFDPETYPPYYTGTVGYTGAAIKLLDEMQQKFPRVAQRPGQLRLRASQAGVDAARIERAMASSTPKADLIRLVMSAEPTTWGELKTGAPTWAEFKKQEQDGQNPVSTTDRTWYLMLVSCLASQHPRAWEAAVAVAERAIASKQVRAAAADADAEPEAGDWRQVATSPQLRALLEKIEASRDAPPPANGEQYRDVMAAWRSAQQLQSV